MHLLMMNSMISRSNSKHWCKHYGIASILTRLKGKIGSHRSGIFIHLCNVSHVRYYWPGHSFVQVSSRKSVNFISHLCKFFSRKPVAMFMPPCAIEVTSVVMFMPICAIARSCSIKDQVDLKSNLCNPCGSTIWKFQSNSRRHSPVNYFGRYHLSSLQSAESWCFFCFQPTLKIGLFRSFSSKLSTWFWRYNLPFVINFVWRRKGKRKSGVWLVTAPHSQT